MEKEYNMFTRVNNRQKSLASTVCMCACDYIRVFGCITEGEVNISFTSIFATTVSYKV